MRCQCRKAAVLHDSDQNHRQHHQPQQHWLPDLPVAPQDLRRDVRQQHSHNEHGHRSHGIARLGERTLDDSRQPYLESKQQHSRQNRQNIHVAKQIPHRQLMPAADKNAGVSPDQNRLHDGVARNVHDPVLAKGADNDGQHHICAVWIHNGGRFHHIEVKWF